MQHFPVFWLCIMLNVMMGIGFAQSSDCNVTVKDIPNVMIGLVYPSDNFLMPHRGEFHNGAIAMLQTIKRCSDIKVEWVSEVAEDYDDAYDAVYQLVDKYDVKLIVGGGSTAISDGLAVAVRELDLILWETTDGLSFGGTNAFSATTSNIQRGQNVADFVGLTYGDEARVALIYNERDRASEIADGIKAILQDNIIIENKHNESAPTHDLALSIRRQEIDVVIPVTFQTVADSLWRSMRDVDANVEAWLNVGDPGYRYGLCRRIGESDGLITIHRFAMTKPDNPIYDLFASHYQTEFGEYPSEHAHLTASGVYILMTYVLPHVKANPSTDTIRQAIYNATASIGDGLMGEGLSIDVDSGSNELASLVVQQNQGGQVCTVSPSALSTCTTINAFPTWRERAIVQDERGCTEPWPEPDI